MDRRLLADPTRGVVIAVEVESRIRRVEQLLRWATAKADALASAREWPFGVRGKRVPVSRLLILRATRANRQVIEAAGTVLREAYPGNPQAALQSLRGDVAWPGPSLLWARDDAGAGAILLSHPSSRVRR